MIHKPAASAPPPAYFVRASPPGTGGIATYVLDGWGLASKFQPIFRSKRELRLSTRGDLFFGRVVDKDGRVIDEAVAAFLTSDESPTGFEQIELSCHGGAGATAAVEDALLKAGFKRGAGADLLARAHLNQKLSLVAVEAQLLLARAATARQAEFLLGHGVLQKRWERFGFDAAMGLRTKDLLWRGKTLDAARAALARGGVARALLRPLHAVLIGPANAGKSTLANRLARADKHIVSALPGTTRDRLDTRVCVRGLDVTLSDTAGLRAAGSDVEREGQRRARAALEAAGLRMIVLDGSRAPDEADLELVAQCKRMGPSILVLNKEDLGLDESAEGLGFLAGVEPVTLSAQSGAGVERLEDAIEFAVLGGIVPEAGDAFTQRQACLLTEIRECIENGWEDTLIIRAIGKLAGTRSHPEQLQIVLSA